MSRGDGLAYGPNGRPQVLAERCSTYVFQPGNPMRLAPGRLAELIARNVTAGTLLACHQTLPYGEHPEVGEAACRGFVDAHGPRTTAYRITHRLFGGFDDIPPP